MRTSYTLKLIGAFFIFLFLLSAQTTHAQSVSVTSTGGITTSALYNNLKHAFDSINTGYQTGIIDIQVIGNCTETATAKLDSSGRVYSWGTSDYTSITIIPVGGAWTISGAIAAGSPLIDLNGADNVTINGLANGTDSLIISNTTTSTTSNTSTIRLINDATNNILTNLKVLTGLTNTTLTTNGGAVFISTGITTGNDNNTISNCYFSNVATVNTSFSYKFLYVNGSTTDSIKANSNIIITNNQFVNFRTSGVYVNSGSKDITISNNHFYHTVTMASATTFSPIYVNNLTSGIGEGFAISGNYIGGSDMNCGGTKPTITTTSFFQLIYLRCATTRTSTIDGNTISNISLSTNVNSTEVGLIYVKDGKVNIGSNIGNLLGSLTDTSNIIITNNSTSGGNYVFISLGGNVASPVFDSIRIENNLIGGITVNALSTNTPSIRGFDNVGSTGTFIFRNNSFGIPGMANSIQIRGQSGNYFGIIFRNSSPASHECVNNYIGNWTCYSTVSNNGRVRGISLNNTMWRVDSNYIENLVSYTSNLATSANIQAQGIYISGLKGSCVGNTIRNIIAAHPSALSSATGIEFTVFSGAPGVIVAGNKISNIYSLSSDSSLVIGLKAIGTSTTNVTVHNNQISLGKDSLGIDIITAHRFNGIVNQSGNGNFYFNSVLLDGASTNIAVNTYAINSTSADNTNIVNNVFSNQRSFTTSSLTTANFAASFNGIITSGAIPATTTNFNLYYAGGTGGMPIYNNGTSYIDLSSWQGIAYAHDANSVSGFPNFISYNELKGGNPTAIVTGDVSLTITIDITNTPRIYNSMGAYDLTLVLPVKLTSFQANKSKNDVALSWVTASESNNKGFELERSDDGRSFRTIAVVKGKGNAQTTQKYSFIDKDAFAPAIQKMLYYRLKQIDFDGKYFYSNILIISNNENVQLAGTVYPNPVKDQCSLQLPIIVTGTIGITITDMNGKEMINRNVELTETSDKVSINQLSGLQPGIYFVKLTNAATTVVSKFIKE
jgi:hypothetical protein